MSIVSKPVTAEAASIPKHVPSDAEFRHYRPSYSPENGLKFKPIFDLMLSSQQPQQITCEDTGLRTSTLFLKAQDALKWLADMHPTEASKYAQLRRIITIRRDEANKRIVLLFKAGAMIATPVNTSEVQWRTDFEKWLGTAQPGEIWDTSAVYKDPIVVAAKDKEWLEQLLSQLDDVEADIQPTRVKVMR